MGWFGDFLGNSSAEPPKSLDAGSTTSAPSSAPASQSSPSWGSTESGQAFTAGMSKAGGLFSSFGASGAPTNTGGQFTMMGANFGPYGALIGAVADVGLSAKMKDKADAQNKKNAANFLTIGLANMDSLREDRDMQKGAVKAQLGATGAELTSGTSASVQAKTNRVADFNYDVAYQDMLQQYKQIKNGGGGGGGGLFGAFG